MNKRSDDISANLASIQRRIEAACGRAGRDPSTVTLVSVSKTVEETDIRAAFAAGARDFGENYGQHLRDKAAAMTDLAQLRWHFIGPLQRNKVKYAVGRSALLHNVSDESVLREVNKRAGNAGLVQDVLVQLNLSGEASKSGIARHDLGTMLSLFAGTDHVRCVGLMTMPPFFDDPESARPIFSELRQVQGNFREKPYKNVELKHLSMGMSGDFEVGIEEGATLVRVGTSIFGARNY